MLHAVSTPQACWCDLRVLLDNAGLMQPLFSSCLCCPKCTFADIVSCNALFVVRLQLPVAFVVQNLTGMLAVPRNSRPQDTPVYRMVEHYFAVQFVVRRLCHSSRKLLLSITCIAAALTQSAHEMH
jgi:hypothetical protein